ncbi:MAG: hemolysin III family protein [Lentisphaeria bacterium]|nr:hemolysin III family protein [Lentisphaeria bacterium]
MAETEKKYTPREEFINAATHFAGCLASLGGIFYILQCKMVKAGALGLAAGLFYGISLVFMFGCSGLYHSCKDVERRKFLRQLDHCAIFFLITGSYAPLLYSVSRDLTGLIIFILLAVLSIAGTVGRFLNWRSLRKIEIVLYVIMGWCCVAIAGKLINQLPSRLLWLLLGGGIAYTGGIAAYIKRREFSHAFWHLFVLAGAALQFLAITGALDL